MAEKLANQQLKILSIVTIASVAVVAVLFQTFSVAIISACIAAFIFKPIHLWFERKLKNTGRATLLTLLSSFFVVFIPMCLILLLSVRQVEVMIADVTKLLESNKEFFDADSLLVGLNDFLATLTDNRVQVTAIQIQDFVLNAIKTLGEAFVGILQSSISSIAAAVTSVIIFIYVYAALLSNTKAIISFVERLNPLGRDITKIYLNKAGLMTKSMVVVQVVVAIVQGIIGAISLKIAGLDYFVFFAVLLSVMSIIPLGGGILTIPIGIVMVALGNIFGGVLVLLTHFVIVTNIDNVLKAKLLSKDLKLHPALAMISILSGVTIFGFIGLIIGPVLMILAMTTIQMYLQYKENNVTKKT